MRRNPLVRTPARIVPFILLFAGLLPAPAPAKQPSWQENISVLVQVAGKPDGSAHVYDSDDYQEMLLVLEDRPVAYLLDLAATSVSGVPRDSVHVDGEGIAWIGNAPRDLLTTLDQKEGTLSFTQDEIPIAIQPLPPLIGPAKLERILELKPSYVVAAQKYKPDPAKLAAIKAVASDTEIRVFFGTWCLMCKRMVPGLIRTLELAANPKIHVDYVGVDEDMREPENEIRASSVSKTPSVLVIQGGREIGRIEEKCTTTIEGDLAAILAPKR
jgi:thioredoxin 1